MLIACSLVLLTVCHRRKSLYREGYSEAISENQSVGRSDSVMYGLIRCSADPPTFCYIMFIYLETLTIL